MLRPALVLVTCIVVVSHAAYRAGCAAPAPGEYAFGLSTEGTSWTVSRYEDSSDTADSFDSPPTLSACALGGPPVDLGTAARFAVLSLVAFTHAQGVHINGDAGAVAAGVTAFNPYFPPAPGHNGYLYQNHALSFAAHADVTLAALDLFTRTECATYYVGAKDLGGLTLTPGLYTTETVLHITAGDLTLDAQHHPDAVFIFRARTSFAAAANKRVLLVNGARSENVYWRTGTSVTLATGSATHGTFISTTAVTFAAAASHAGRVFSLTTTVTLGVGAGVGFPSIIRVRVGVRVESAAIADRALAHCLHTELVASVEPQAATFAGPSTAEHSDRVCVRL